MILAELTVGELLRSGAVLVVVLGVQLAGIYGVYRLRQGWRRRRGLPPVDTSPKVDPLTWGRLTRRGRGSADASHWTPVGNPERFTRSRRRPGPEAPPGR